MSKSCKSFCQCQCQCCHPILTPPPPSENQLSKFVKIVCFKMVVVGWWLGGVLSCVSEKCTLSQDSLPLSSAAHCPSNFCFVLTIPPYFLQLALSFIKPQSCSSSLIFNKPEIISTVWIIRHHLRILVCYATGTEKSGQKDQCRHSFLFKEEEQPGLRIPPQKVWIHYWWLKCRNGITKFCANHTACMNYIDYFEIYRNPRAPRRRI